MSRYLAETAAAAELIAWEDLDVDLEPRSENDRLRVSFQHMTAKLRAMRDAATTVASGRLDVTLEAAREGSLSYALVEIVRYLQATSDSVGVEFGDIRDHLQRQAVVATRIAQSDLAVKVIVASERDVLGQAFADMVSNLQAMVGELVAAAERVDGSSGQVELASREVGRGMEEVAHSIAGVAQAAERHSRVSIQVRELGARRTRGGTCGARGSSRWAYRSR